MAPETIGHFKVLAKLGEGGMGAVYKVRDLTLERFAAVKIVLPDQAADSSRRRRFIREAKAASALNHPNIITVYEIDEWEGADYIAMEFIEGRTLRSLVKSPPELTALLPILSQLAEALAAAHAAGIVHRDIKPENLMLRDDGYVKVLDFGVARLVKSSSDAGAALLTRPGALVGTARYMSPEQARGEPAESPSDVFSMGIVFYELATGAHPFPAKSTGAALHAVLSDSPFPPARVKPEIPAALNDLIVRMLAKDAVLRPTAAAVQAELFLMSQSGSALPASRPAAVRRLAVGREREMAEMHEAFKASVGSWTMLCVTGEAGLGKTTLVEDFLEEIRARPGAAWIGRGRCSERLGASEGLLPILEGLDSLVRGETGYEAARILKRFAPNWYSRIAASLADSGQDELTEAARTASPERMKLELASFFQQLASTRPVILFFDDMHWSDVSTCDLIAYLGGACRDSSVLLVATYRPSALVAQHPFPRVRLAVHGRGACRDLPLDFLQRTAVERMVAIQFPDHRFPRTLLDLVQGKTEGNPLFVVEVLRYLRDRAVVVPHDSTWVLAQPLSALEKDVPATIRSMIQLKIDRLSEADRRLLLAASVQGVGFDSAVLARALGLDPAEVEERLQALEEGDALVAASGEQEFPDRTLTVCYRFVHVFYQNALYSSLTPSRRSATSASIANAILGFGGGDVPGRAADLAFLFESARDFARAAPFFLSASRHSARVFAYPEAAILARKGLAALQSLPDTDQRARLELPLSVMLGVAVMATSGYAAPELEQTHLRSRALCRRLGNERHLRPVLWALFSYYLIAGQLTKALEVSREMLDPAVGSDDTAFTVQALQGMGVALGYMGRLRESRECLERLLTEHDPRRHPFSSIYVLDPGVTALVMLGRFLTVMGHPDQALRHSKEAEARARELDHPHSLGYAIFGLAWVRHDRGEVQAARAQAEAAMALGEQYGLRQILEWSRMVRGWALVAQGLLADGIEEMRRSLEAQLDMQARLERPYCLALLAAAVARLRYYDEALGLFDEALMIVEVNEERSYEAEIRRLRGEVLLARAFESADTLAPEDEPERDGGAPREALLCEAEAEVNKAIAVARQAEARMLELRAATSLVRLRQRVGDPRSARASLAEILAWFTEGASSPYVAEARELIAPD